LKLSPPGSLRLDRERLLEDVQARLAERMPGLDEADPDPTDPGWLLLEQATWLAEQLSAELDRYPLAVLQQFLHLVGARLEPAVPPVGVLVVSPREAGEIQVNRDRPADWRFFTAQTEDRDPIEFVPAEPSAPLSPLEVRGTWWWDGTQLFNVTGPRADGGEGAGGSVVPTGNPNRSAAFDRERVDYRLVATDTETLLERINGVIEKMNVTDSAWLELEAKQVGDSEVVVEARISSFAALQRAAGGRVAPGGDLLVPWQPVEGSTWTPPVKFAKSPRLPLRLRGSEPMPGPEDGTLLIRSLPASLSLENLLIPSAAPLPRPVVDAIWRALRRLDSRVSGLRPQVERSLETPEGGSAPSPWISAVLRSNAWARLTGTTPRSFVYLEVPEEVEVGRRLRIALQWPRPASLADVQAWAIDEAGISDDPLNVTEAWSLPVPSPTDSQGLDHVQALDIEIAAGQNGILLSLQNRPRAVLPNAIVVINAPLVPDGRELIVERAVPESASLLEEDIVGPDVMSRLLQQPLGDSTRRMLAALPLARFTVPIHEPIDDFEGIGLDSTEGRIVFNAPDGDGSVRDLRPQTSVTIEWYRRTDGSTGEVEPGTIRYVEQAPSTRPHLNDCVNPSAAWFGSERESEIDARERMFSPTSDLPVVPGDWERLIRRELGARARGWIVRVWGHAERALISTACWPIGDHDEAPEARRFQAALETAGPDTLVVVLGPRDRVLAMAELDAARRVINAVIKRVRRRLPTIQRTEVTRLWPLTMEVEDNTNPPLPCFAAPDLSGTLVDPTGGRSSPPAVALLLNAAVVEVVEVTP
jgi:hypothetical protein